MKRIVVAVFLLLGFSVAYAAIESRQFETRLQETRYNALIKELRCLVCQNQNLADSDADLAKDLRSITYDMIMAGKSDSEITAFMVERYGEFVLYRPPFNIHTLLLWLAPLLLVVIGAWIFITIVNNRKKEAAVDTAKLDHARSLLDDEDRGR